MSGVYPKEFCDVMAGLIKSHQACSLIIKHVSEHKLANLNNCRKHDPRSVEDWGPSRCLEQTP